MTRGGSVALSGVVEPPESPTGFTNAAGTKDPRTRAWCGFTGCVSLVPLRGNGVPQALGNLNLAWGGMDGIAHFLGERDTSNFWIRFRQLVLTPGTAVSVLHGSTKVSSMLARGGRDGMLAACRMLGSSEYVWGEAGGRHRPHSKGRGATRGGTRDTTLVRTQSRKRLSLLGHGREPRRVRALRTWECSPARTHRTQDMQKDAAHRRPGRVSPVGATTPFQSIRNIRSQGQTHVALAGREGQSYRRGG